MIGKKPSGSDFCSATCRTSGCGPLCGPRPLFQHVQPGHGTFPIDVILQLPCHWQVGLGTLRRNVRGWSSPSRRPYSGTAYHFASAVFVWCLCALLPKRRQAKPCCAILNEARKHSHICMFHTVGALIQKPIRSEEGPSVSVGFHGFWSFSVGFGIVSYPPGLILESVFLWLCFSRQKPSCMLLCYICCAVRVQL